MKRIFRIEAYVVLAIALCTFMAYRMPLEGLPRNQARGDRIVEAIKQYEQIHDEAPPSLRALIPTYITEIPRTITGEAFIYQSEDQSAYNDWTLTFNVKWNGTGCTYIAHFEFWDCWPPNAGKH